MNAKLLTILTFILIASLIGCNKEGDPGPQGPIGEPGPQGAVGPAGAVGTANVMYSEWMDANWNFNNGSTYKAMRVIEPNCTNSFNSSGGIVLCYFRFQHNVVYQMPHTDYSNQNYKYGIPVFFDDAGEVRFSIESINATALTDAESNGSTSSPLQFKYVLIPGGVALTSGRLSSPVDFSDYEEVKMYYNLPD